jgi:hypothetical protein
MARATRPSSSVHLPTLRAAADAGRQASDRADEKRGHMAARKLTKKQRELAVEVGSLFILSLDPGEIATDHDAEGRTTYLKLAKDQIIRSAIVLKYLLMDELLNAIICWHYFGKKRSFQQLWKTKRFRSFNYFILERLYLLQKLDLVRSIHPIPKWVSSDLGALNELRNGAAHSSFPQNRRRKPEWKGQNVFRRPGFERFLEDMQKLVDFFVERFWAGSPEDPGDRPEVTAQEREPSGA